MVVGKVTHYEEKENLVPIEHHVPKQAPETVLQKSLFTFQASSMVSKPMKDLII